MPTKDKPITQYRLQTPAALDALSRFRFEGTPSHGDDINAQSATVHVPVALVVATLQEAKDKPVDMEYAIAIAKRHGYDAVMGIAVLLRLAILHLTCQAAETPIPPWQNLPRRTLSIAMCLASFPVAYTADSGQFSFDVKKLHSILASLPLEDCERYS